MQKKEDYTLIPLREKPELLEEAAQWFSDKWEVPVAAYRESMEESLQHPTAVPQWYLVVEGEQGKENILAGAGIIENDYHNRKDLAPNFCALFVLPEYRGQGIAGRLLQLAQKDAGRLGFPLLYLVTDHTSFYEQYGWEYVTDVQGDDGFSQRLYQIKTL